MEDKHKSIFLVILLLAFAYWSYLVIKPFFSFLVLGTVMAVLFHPLYKHASRVIGESLAAILSIITVILLVVIPSLLAGATLVGQARDAYGQVMESGVDLVSIASHIPGVEAEDLQQLIPAKSTVAAALPSIISMTSTLVIGMLLFVFVMYYALRDGKEWYSSLSNVLPFKPAHRRRLKDEIEQMTRALFYGQILTAALIGIGCGTVLWYFGVPNPVFWGFLMMILAFLPLLGAPVVYLPVGIWFMLNDRWGIGIAVIVLCTIIIFLIEYIVRPKFVSKTGQIHPLTAIVGALGGIYLLGFVGFLIGPLILGIFLTLLSFDYRTDG